MPNNNKIPVEELMLHADSLYQFALSRVKDHHVAEDLVQECLLAGWQSIDKFNAQSSLKTWLCGIMKFKIIDYYRGSKRSPSEQSMTPNDDRDPLDSLFDSHGSWKIDPNYGLKMLTQSPDEIASQNELLDWIHTCLEKLPERLRTLFTLREVDGLDVSSAAATAGVTAGSAAVLLTRSRQKLRSCLQDHGIQP